MDLLDLILVDTDFMIYTTTFFFLTLTCYFNIIFDYAHSATLQTLPNSSLLLNCVNDSPERDADKQVASAGD